MEKIEKSIVEPQKIIVDPEKNLDNFIKDEIYMVIEHVKITGTSRISPPKIFFGKFYRQYDNLVQFSDLETNRLRDFFAYEPNEFYKTNINDIIKPNRGRGRRSHIRRSKKHKRTHKKRKL